LVGGWAQGDKVGDLSLHLANRQVQFAGPEVQAIPAQLALMRVEQRAQLQLGHGEAGAVQFGIALGQKFEPEVIIEMQVQQGAVHVQQDSIDSGPGQGSGHVRLKWFGRRWAMLRQRSVRCKEAPAGCDETTPDPATRQVMIALRVSRNLSCARNLPCLPVRSSPPAVCSVSRSCSCVFPTVWSAPTSGWSARVPATAR